MSKPKPGLGKGIARTLAHHPAPTPPQPVIHHSASVPPIVSSSSHLSRSPYISVYSTTTHRQNQWLPATLQSHLALLPLWDATPPTTTTTELGRRSYATSSAPRRASVESAAYSLPPSLPPSLLFDRPRLAFNDFALPPPPPPPPPPSVSPSQSPPHPVKQLRPSEPHTVLSPTPQLNSGPSPSPSPPITYLGFRPDPVNLHSPSPIPDLNNLNLYSSNLIFHLGASGSAKERIVTPPPRRERSQTTPPPRPRSFPLPDVTPPITLASTAVGEDAYFTRADGMCVADGVGGWSRSGKGPADPGRWSRLLTHYCEEEVGRWWAGTEDYMTEDDDVSAWASRAWKRNVEDRKHRRPLDPIEIMQKGYEKCLSCAAAEGIYGSSTCLLALLHHSTLLVANLGDCSLLLIRRGEVVFRTSEMQHAFNFPLQLGTHSRDEPMKDAKRYDIGVEREDVVIVGSDGLMDNLFDEDILETLSEFAPPSQTSTLPPFSPQLVSEALCKRARAVSEQTTAMTPFMMRAIEEGIDFVGGKRDDISVLVGVIGDRDGLTLDASSRPVV